MDSSPPSELHQTEWGSGAASDTDSKENLALGDREETGGECLGELWGDWFEHLS